MNHQNAEVDSINKHNQTQMAFTENNTLGKGRKVGSLNVSTATIKNNLQMLVENNLDTLDADLKALSPKDRIKAITDLCKFILPTLKQVDAEVTNTTDLTFLDAFTETQLQILLENS
jgi:hypothetical protein